MHRNWIQKEITLTAKRRGFHLVSREIEGQVPELRFTHDDSAAESRRLSDLIDRAVSADEPG